jgi:hypothetical protein
MTSDSLSSIKTNCTFIGMQWIMKKPQPRMVIIKLQHKARSRYYLQLWIQAIIISAAGKNLPHDQMTAFAFHECQNFAIVLFPSWRIIVLDITYEYEHRQINERLPAIHKSVPATSQQIREYIRAQTRMRAKSGIVSSERRRSQKSGRHAAAAILSFKYYSISIKLLFWTSENDCCPIFWSPMQQSWRARFWFVNKITDARLAFRDSISASRTDGPRNNIADTRRTKGSRDRIDFELCGSSTFLDTVVYKM